MSKINDGGPAFPCETLGIDEHGEYRKPYKGMTLRDYFAAKAMQGILAGWATGLPPSDMTVEASYAYADAMLAARSNT